MKKSCTRSGIISFVFLLALSAAIAQPSTDSVIAARDAEVGGVKLHYLTAGEGPVVILLHGYTQTSRMWRPLIPLLAGKFRVIAPDLPGIGDSAIPADGLDMKTAAIRVHALAKSLGVEKARVVGHDIGLMVAYAYAAQFPSETEKLALLDAFLPGVEGWEAVYDDPNVWHFRFHGPTPEALVSGRERTYFAYFWNDLAADKTRSLRCCRPGSLCHGILPSRAHAGRMGLLRSVAADGQRLCPAGSNQAGDSRFDHRRRQVSGRSARSAGETDLSRRDRHRVERHWTLGVGGTSQRNHRRAAQVSVRLPAEVRVAEVEQAASVSPTKVRRILSRVGRRKPTVE